MVSVSGSTFALPNQGELHGRTGLPRHRALKLHDGKLSRGRAFDFVDQVARLDPGFFRGASGKDCHHRGISHPLRDEDPHVRRSRVRVLQIILILFGGKVRAVGVERLQQPPNGSIRHLVQIRVGDILLLDAIQDFAVNTQVAIGLLGGRFTLPQQPSYENVGHQYEGNGNQCGTNTICHAGMAPSPGAFDCPDA